MNRLRFQWNTAVSTAASCTTWHRTNFTSHSTPAHMRTSTYCSLHMHSQDHTVKTHTCTLSFFFLSLTAFLSFCLCFISQLGGCLSVIITFAIKSKQRGWIEECMPDLLFSTPSAILIVWLLWGCCFFSLLLLSTNGAAFFLKDRFIDRAPAARAQPARVVLFLNGNSFSLSILTLQTLSLGRCVNEDDFMSRGKFDPVCENAWADGTSEWYNWVNELHALICCSFIWAARGMTTISLLHRLLYVWWVPWREF